MSTKTESTGTGSPPRKLDALLALMRNGKWPGALALAAKWPRLGEEKKAIQTAASALLSPEFYRQLGRDPDALVAEGKAALLRRYGQHMGEA